MICHYNPPLDDMELLMTLDGKASQEVEMHVSQCSSCSQRAAELARVQRVATGRLFRAACPPSLDLGEYRLGLMPAAASASIQQHVTTCPFCQQELAQLTTFFNAQDPYLRPALATAIRQRVEVLVARLTGGLQPGGMFGQPALAGLRGEQAGPLTFEAGDAQIIVEVQGDGERSGRRAVVGLVVGLPGQEVQAHLWRNEQRVATAPVDALGGFTFDDLPSGQYELFLTGEQQEIHIQDLQV